MRIAQVSSMEESVPPKHKNGVEFIVSWITEELVRRGHEVTLFASADSITKAKLISLSLQSLTDQKKVLWKQPFASFWNSSLAASLYKDFDIIHSHGQSMPYFIPFIENTAIVETLHNNFPKKREYASSFEFISKQYAKINFVSISKRQLELFKLTHEHFYEKCTNIYNGIPINDFEFNNNPKDYLFFIGYINKNKGADTAVRVAKKLGMKLIIAGSHKGEEEFFDKEIKPYLNDKIKYVGPVNFAKKNELYKNAYVTLAPIAWEEPFGLTLVESQACGTPVIAFNKGAAAEIIDHGKTGFVVENENEMIDAIRKISDIQRLECRGWVEKNFSVTKMVDGYENLYKEILSKK